VNNPPAPDLLHDPFFLTITAAIITIIAAILGSALTIWYTSRQGRKEVVYNIVSDTPILSLEKEIGNQVEVLFNNQVVKDLRLIIAEVWNSGRIPIPPEEFKSPITFSLVEPAKVLDTEVVAQEPTSLKASLQRTPNSVILEPLLLNQNNKVRLKILVSGTGLLSITSGIVGVEIANYSEIAKGREKLYTTFYFTLFGLSAAMIISGFILSLLLVPAHTTPAHPWFIDFLIYGSFVLLLFAIVSRLTRLVFRRR
jgi:hypothetical protein